MLVCAQAVVEQMVEQERKKMGMGKQGYEGGEMENGVEMEKEMEMGMGMWEQQNPGHFVSM